MIFTNYNHKTEKHNNDSLLEMTDYKLEQELGIEYLYLDLKKNDGYKKSIELSKKYNLYRQNYCGCIFSKKEGQDEES